MITAESATERIQDWPEEAREAARLVIEQYGSPHEATPSALTWIGVGPWKRIVAQRAFWDHRFPAPHTDSVESFVDYRVPVDTFTELARFDGSVMAERTTGEVSARCHDEQANMLALNLMDDIVRGEKDAAAARRHYAKEFVDARRKKPTPYMERLRFQPDPRGAADPDERVLSDDELAAAEREGAGGGG
jgi:hypothetical protein